MTRSMEKLKKFMCKIIIVQIHKSLKDFVYRMIQQLNKSELFFIIYLILMQKLIRHGKLILGVILNQNQNYYMRRVSGPPQGNNFYFKKDVCKALKSPLKSKSKGKLKSENYQHSFPVRKTQSFHQKPIDQSVTSHTIHKPKHQKKKTKTVPKLKKYEKQIMQTINQAATLIQREWRKYLIRKYRRSIEKMKQRSPKVVAVGDQINKFDQPSVSACTFSKYQAYNNTKYCQLNTPQKSQIGININQAFNFRIVDTKGQTSIISDELQMKPPGQSSSIRSANYIPNHHRTTSDKVEAICKTKTKFEIQKSQRKLVFQQNAIELKISPNDYELEDRSVEKIAIQKHGQDDVFIPQQKQFIEKVLKKAQQNIEKKKLKKILALQHSFSNNMMTSRSYQKTLAQISEEYRNTLDLFSMKKKKLYDKWLQIIKLSKEEEEAQQGQRIIESHPNRLIPCLNVKFDEQSNQSVLSNTESLDLGINFNQSNRKQIEFEALQWSSDNKINSLERFSIEKQLLAQLEKSRQVQNRQNQQFSNNPAIQTHEESLVIQENQQQITKSINQIKQDQLRQNTKEHQEQDICIVEEIKNQSNIIRIVDNNSEDKQASDQIRKGRVYQDDEEQRILIQEELNTFFPINPSIDYINNWLLEISHFILDNYSYELTTKLIKIKQPSPYELFKYCKSSQPYPVLSYQVVSEKHFQTFEYHHIKSLLSNVSVPSSKRDKFAALTYCFHQALYDSLNRVLQDELVEGKKWINYPWLNQFKVRKIVHEEYAKQCLEKAINRVSSLADYTMFPLKIQGDWNLHLQAGQYSLVLLEQIWDISFVCEATITGVIQQINKKIQMDLVKQQAHIIQTTLMKNF